MKRKEIFDLQSNVPYHYEDNSIPPPPPKKLKQHLISHSTFEIFTHSWRNHSEYEELPFDFQNITPNYKNYDILGEKLSFTVDKPELPNDCELGDPFLVHQEPYECVTSLDLSPINFDDLLKEDLSPPPPPPVPSPPPPPPPSVGADDIIDHLQNSLHSPSRPNDDLDGWEFDYPEPPEDPSSVPTSSKDTINKERETQNIILPENEFTSSAIEHEDDSNTDNGSEDMELSEDQKSEVKDDIIDAASAIQSEHDMEDEFKVPGMHLNEMDRSSLLEIAREEELNDILANEKKQNEILVELIQGMMEGEGFSRAADDNDPERANPEVIASPDEVEEGELDGQRAPGYRHVSPGGRRHPRALFYRRTRYAAPTPDVNIRQTQRKTNYERACQDSGLPPQITTTPRPPLLGTPISARTSSQRRRGFGGVSVAGIQRRITARENLHRAGTRGYSLRYLDRGSSWGDRAGSVTMATHIAEPDYLISKFCSCWVERPFHDYDCSRNHDDFVQHILDVFKVDYRFVKLTIKQYEKRLTLNSTVSIITFRNLLKSNLKRESRYRNP